MTNNKLTPEEENKFNEYLKSLEDSFNTPSPIEEYELVLLNDDTNLFNHVMWCLKEFCFYDDLRSEQIATLVHLKGSCIVFSGSLSLVTELHHKMIEQHLNVKINQVTK